MNIMNKLTLKHIQKNKARTIVTIIGIIISVAMLTAVTTGITSAMRWFRDGEIEDSGKWHAEFNELSLEQLQQLKDNKQFEEVFATREVGYAALEKPLNESKPYIYVKAYDSSALKNMPIKLIEGRLPENEHEIIVSKRMLQDLENKLMIGDTVSYSFGQRYLKNTTNEEILAQYGVEREVPLTQENDYLDGKTERCDTLDNTGKKTIASEEIRLNGEKNSYTIVGIIERPGYEMEPYSAPGYTAYTFLDEKFMAADGTVNGYCYYKKVTRKIYHEMEVTSNQLGFTSPSSVNDHVLYYEGVSPEGGFTDFILIMYIILIAIIVIGSVSLIYNSFAISISERSKQLGMLASVGATKRQKRNSVFFEAFLYGIIGIPVGILSGLLGITIAFKVVSSMILDSFEISVPLVTVISAETLIASALLAVITIFISAYIPARKASKISAIEAIRQSKDIQIKVKKVRTLWITKKLFGFEGELAIKNMKRNRRRYRSIIFSLFISVVLFIIVSSYIHYVTGAYFMANTTANYDIALSMYQDKEFKEEEVRNRDRNLAEEIKQTGKLSNITTSHQLSVVVAKDKIESFYSDKMKAFIEEKDAAERTSHYISINALDDDSFEAYCKKSGIDAEKVRTTPNGVILLNVLEPRENYTVKKFPIFSINPGDTLNTIERKNEPEEYNATKLTVAATSTELPIGISGYQGNIESDIIAIVPEKTFMSIYHEKVKGIQQERQSHFTSSFFINTEEDEAVYKEVTTILAENKISSGSYSLVNIVAQEKSDRQVIYAMSIFAYGFIILMSMICCANMCNTISTSISLRRTEFAMLKSVGMTPKKFHRMIRFESLLYGVKAIVYGIPVSQVCAYMLFKYVRGRFTVSFLLPWYIYLIAIVFVFSVVGCAMLYSSSKVRKENIIDGLKNELS